MFRVALGYVILSEAKNPCIYGLMQMQRSFLAPTENIEAPQDDNSGVLRCL